MIKGSHILLRSIKDEDWETIEAWGRERDALWGAFQRFQLDHVPLLRRAYHEMGLLSRQSALLLIETIQDQKIIGFVRYTLIPYPDADMPQPEIGFGVPPASARGYGYAQEAVRILVAYLFDGYAVERVTAFTEQENIPAQRVLEKAGFQREGTLRRAMFRDGQWRDMLIFGILRRGAQHEQIG